APVKVDLNGCAALTDALISWAPGAPPTPKALGWSGRNDQYDVRGGSWVRLAADAPMPDGPTSLDAWSKAFGPEAAPAPPPVRFATDPASLSGEAHPRDFAVESLAAQAPGADPAFVGPGARPVPSRP